MNRSYLAILSLALLGSSAALAEPGDAEITSLQDACTSALATVTDLHAQHQPATPDQLKDAAKTCAVFSKASTGTRFSNSGYALNQKARKLAQENRSYVSAAASANRDAARKDRDDALAQTTVRGRFPEFTSDDSYDPAKIADAFEKAPAEMIYYEKQPAIARLELTKREWHTCEHSDGRPHTFASWSHNGESSVAQMNDNEPYVAGTPLLIWERKVEHGVGVIEKIGTFVTLDGLRYTTEHLTDLEHGMPPRTGWPQHPRNTCMTDKLLEVMEGDGVVPPAQAKQARDAFAAAAKCAAKVWDSDSNEVKANDVANITQSTRANRYSELLDRYRKKVEATCAAQLRGYESAMIAAMQPRVKQRKAALDRAAASLAGKAAAN